MAGSRGELRLDNLSERLSGAIESFWSVRADQSLRQGAGRAGRDKGKRAAVTGGKHADALAILVAELLTDNGVPEESIHRKSGVELPGYFRPEKKWDLLVVHEKKLVACIEFKSQVGSFGNNYNNRTEESIGNALDVGTAFREGAFAPSMRPWVGYLMVLQRAEASMRPVGVKETHFPVFSEFRGASYAQRYQETLMRLMRESLYDQCCLLLTSNEQGRPSWEEPTIELGFERFARSLLGYWIAAASSP